MEENFITDIITIAVAIKAEQISAQCVFVFKLLCICVLPTLEVWARRRPTLSTQVKMLYLRSLQESLRGS